MTNLDCVNSVCLLLSTKNHFSERSLAKYLMQNDRRWSSRYRETKIEECSVVSLAIVSQTTHTFMNSKSSKVILRRPSFWFSTEPMENFRLRLWVSCTTGASGATGLSKLVDRMASSNFILSATNWIAVHHSSRLLAFSAPKILSTTVFRYSPRILKAFLWTYELGQ